MIGLNRQIRQWKIGSSVENTGNRKRNLTNAYRAVRITLTIMITLMDLKESMDMSDGVIFDLKQFAVFDGPGVRQTVFLKGCPLHCNWCHNPEGLSAKPQLMVSKASCINCGRCQEVCQHKTCIACGACVPVCPLHLRAISGERVSAEELEQRLRKDSAYYAQLGGGVTFSGGEPLMQGDFLLDVLGRIADLHRCIETSGYAEQDLFQAVVKKLDYVIMDLKLLDPEKHRQYTGVGNEKILRNAAYLCQADVPFTIRIPLIPGVNDNDENFRQTAQFLSGAKHLQQVELLPYHKTAGAKYAMAGMTYTPKFDINRSVYTSQKIFQDYQIRSSVL